MQKTCSGSFEFVKIQGRGCFAILQVCETIDDAVDSTNSKLTPKVLVVP